MRRSALVLLFLVAACGSIGAQAHTISLAYKTGDVYKYAFHMVLKYTVGAEGMAAPLDMDLKAKETLTVKSVDSTGTADIAIELTDTSITLSVAGTTNTTTTTTPTTAEMKVTADGQVVSINGSALGQHSFSGLGGTQGGLITAILPDKAVKPGDTWSKSFDEPNPVGTGSSHLTSDNTYLRDEKVGGVNTALVESKIKTTIDMTLDLSALGSMVGGASGASASPAPTATGGGFIIKGTSSSDVQTWVDITARRVVKTHSSGTVDATLTINTPATGTTPVITGPLTIKGTQTLDLAPA